jgi:DNA-directed RNA polymerase specialized sigma24 family protein
MFRDLITSEYNTIQQYVRKKAFVFHLNESDLLSAVNEKLAINVNNKDFELNHVSQFRYYVSRTANSCAIDLIRRRGAFVELDGHDRDSGIDLEVTSSAVRIINAVLGGIKRPAHKEVFMAVVVDGENMKLSQLGLMCL